MYKGDAYIQEGNYIRRCRKCQEFKALEQFISHWSWYCHSCRVVVDQETKNKLHKDLSPNQVIKLQSKRRRRQERGTKGTHVESFRYCKYGLTTNDIKGMLDRQDSKCCICKDSIDMSAHIDHCHSTNKVRGLLCRGCNLGLGQFKDNKDILYAAFEYLKNS